MPDKLVSDSPFPAYSYVPGRFPHPTHSPLGHSHDRKKPPSEALDPMQWESCREYLWGIDLFNHGYYWEAHEAWEGLWHLAGRRGLVADFLKALIALAAAGVKAREGRVPGVRGHALRAHEIFKALAAPTSSVVEGSTSKRVWMGLNLDFLSDASRRVAEAPDRLIDTGEVPVAVVMPFALTVEGTRDPSYSTTTR